MRKEHEERINKRDRKSTEEIKIQRIKMKRYREKAISRAHAYSRLYVCYTHKSEVRYDRDAHGRDFCLGHASRTHMRSFINHSSMYQTMTT